MDAPAPAAAFRPLGSGKGGTAAAAIAVAVLLAALAGSAGLDRRMTAWSHPSLAATRDTPYGRVSVTERSGQVAVSVNDALAYESEGTGAEELVHLAARGPGPRLVTPAYVRYLYTNDRFAGTMAALSRAGVPVDTDGRPATRRPCSTSRPGSSPGWRRPTCRRGSRGSSRAPRGRGSPPRRSRSGRRSGSDPWPAGSVAAPRGWA